MEYIIKGCIFQKENEKNEKKVLKAFAENVNSGILP